jgi:hypothetical protein
MLRYCVFETGRFPEELRDLLERLETAIASGDVASITDARVPLDDLVFYLQDA